MDTYSYHKIPCYHVQTSYAFSITFVHILNYHGAYRCISLIFLNPHDNSLGTLSYYCERLKPIGKYLSEFWLFNKPNIQHSNLQYKFRSKSYVILKKKFRVAPSVKFYFPLLKIYVNTYNYRCENLLLCSIPLRPKQPFSRSIEFTQIRRSIAFQLSDCIKK